MKNTDHWLALFEDKAYVDGVVENATRLALRHRDESGLAAVEAEAGGCGNDAGRVFDLVEAHFDLPRIERMLTVERDAFAATETYSSKFQGFANGAQTALAIARARDFIALLVAIDPFQLRLAKRRTPGDRRTITFAGTPNSVRVLKGNLRARIWSIPPFSDSDDLAALGGIAAPGAPFDLAAGDNCRVSSFETVEYLPGADPLLLLITQASDGEAPMTVVCDADSGRIVSTHAIGQAPSRLQMLSTMLRMFGRADAWDAIRDLLDHPLHFVRWHAMRELVAFDPARSLPDLTRLMEHDPQPAVRRCARATLAIVNAHLDTARAA